MDETNHDAYAPPEVGSVPEPDGARKRAWVPAAAVAGVAVAAVVAVVMSRNQGTPGEELRATGPALQRDVVRAPPLNPTQSMGGSPACLTCGTVQAVAAGTTNGRNFQMRIRMDDGSVRTVEQRGALPAGSRVVVDGNNVQLIPG